MNDSRAERPAGEYHTPVLLNEVLSGLLAHKPDMVVDATLGGGGHSEAILETLPECRLIGLDVDQDAIAFSQKRLARFGGRFRTVRANFRALESALRQLGVDRVGAVLMDLGVSSRQLENPERGFSFKFDGPLDMRMDQRIEETAADWINRRTEEELADIIRRYGEQRGAERIARAIVRERQNDEIRTTQQFSEVVARALGLATKTARPRIPRGGRIHPATKTFQAIRMAVNDELGAVEHGLEQAVNRLSIGGRLAVITFHSLEDRLVKTVFRREEKENKRLQWINRHVIRAQRQEILENPRSRSAKLRVVEKTGD